MLRVTQMVETSLPALLRERASLQPDDTAYTFLYYEQDWAGVSVSLTWPQLYRRVLNVARGLRGCASPGDRAMVIAPQGLDYIVAFFGALQAGVIPVPLSVPMGGVADERVESVLRDAVPVAVLTTSAVVTEVAASVAAPPSGGWPVSESLRRSSTPPSSRLPVAAVPSAGGPSSRRGAGSRCRFRGRFRRATRRLRSRSQPAQGGSCR